MSDARESTSLAKEGAPELIKGVRRNVQIGGQTKAQLLERLAEHGIEMNEAGKILFASDKFVTSAVRTRLLTVEVTVRELGFPQGATRAEIDAAALRLGLRLCPLEVGPYLRLQLLDQPEGFLGYPATEHRAPPGSIGIASEILSEEYEFPKGFYLRRIKGVLWLRGYWSGPEHVCDAEEHLVFVRDAVESVPTG